jgi:hypothetical protein
VIPTAAKPDAAADKSQAKPGAPPAEPNGRNRNASHTGGNRLKSLFGFVTKRTAAENHSDQSSGTPRGSEAESKRSDPRASYLSTTSDAPSSFSPSPSSFSGPAGSNSYSYNTGGYMDPVKSGTGSLKSEESDCTIPDDDAVQARQGAELTAEQIDAFNESTKLMINHDTAVKSKKRRPVAASRDPNDPDAVEEEEYEDDEDDEVINGWQMRRLTLIPNIKPSDSEESLEEENKVAPLVLFKLHLWDESTSILKMAGDLTMELVLKNICNQYEYVYKDMTFESGEKPNLETVEMDRRLEYYQSKDSKLFDLWVMKKSKTYSTVSVTDGENLVLTYQMIDGT